MKYDLRPIEEHDHEWLVDLHNDPLVLRNITHPQPVTMAHHLVWWKKVSHDRRQLRLIFTCDDRPAGLTKFYDIDEANGCCVLGGDIHADFRGQGHAKHMWQLILNRSFIGLGLHRVSLTTAEYNLVALHVYEGLGFRHEGKHVQSLRRDDRYYDELCMYMLHDDWRATR